MRSDAQRRALLLRRVLTGLVLIAALGCVWAIHPQSRVSLAGWTPGCPELAADEWTRIPAARFEPSPKGSGRFDWHTPLWIASESQTLVQDIWNRGEADEATFCSATTQVRLTGQLHPRWTLEPTTITGWDEGELLWLPCNDFDRASRLSHPCLVGFDPIALVERRRIALPVPASVKPPSGMTDIVRVAILPDGAWVIAGNLRGDLSPPPFEGLYCWRVDPVSELVTGPAVTPLSPWPSRNGAIAGPTHDTTLITLNDWLPACNRPGDDGAWELVDWPASASEPTWLLRPAADVFHRYPRPAKPPTQAPAPPWQPRDWETDQFGGQSNGVAVDFALLSTSEATCQGLRQVGLAGLPNATVMPIVSGMSALDDGLEAAMGPDFFRWRTGYLLAPWLPQGFVPLPNDTARPMQICQRYFGFCSGFGIDGNPFGLWSQRLDGETTLFTQLIPQRSETLLRFGRFAAPMTSIQWDGYITVPVTFTDGSSDASVMLFADSTGIRILVMTLPEPDSADPVEAQYLYSHIATPPGWPHSPPGWLSDHLTFTATRGEPCILAPQESS